MDYCPEKRGPFPVGVSSENLPSERAGRSSDCTIYYPAHPRLANAYQNPKNHDRYCVLPGMAIESRHAALRDAQVADIAQPLVLFSHGFASDRRQSSFLCVHLASHGYRVVCPSHPGNTVEDAARSFLPKMVPEGSRQPPPSLADIMSQRPRDLVRAMKACAGAGSSEDEIGVVGHSFGGWTCFAAASLEPRIVSIVALAPAGGRNEGRSNPMAEALQLPHTSQPSTLILAARRDTVLPLGGILELYERCPHPKTLAILKNADHMHFCDRAEQLHEFVRNSDAMQKLLRIKDEVPPFGDLCTEELAHTACKALCLAHLDATLRRKQQARDWFQSQAASWLTDKDVELTTASPSA